MNNIPKLQDSDVELSDADSLNISADSALSSHRERESRPTVTPTMKANKTFKTTDDDIDDNSDDEESILQRLSGNYRRFSETQRSRDILDNIHPTSSSFDGNEPTTNNSSNNDGNVQILARNLRTVDGNDDGGSIIEEDEYIDSDEEEQEAYDHNDDDAMENDVGDGDEDSDDPFGDITNEAGNHDHHEGSEDEDGEEQDEFASSTALRMLASALSGSTANSDVRSAFENFLSTVNRPNSNESNNTTDNNDNNSDRNINNNRTGAGSPFNRGGRSEMTRLLLDHLMPSSNNSRISSLIDDLNSHKDPYTTMETLNEISSSLLMMTSIQSEREVPTYTLAESLVNTINEYPDHLELQLVACRCIHSLAEVNFQLMPEIVSAGVIECLNSKLLDLSYIDMAEQALQALELISRRAGRQCLNKGSIPVALTYLDFFTIHAQRKALKIAANSSVLIPQSKYDDIATVFPTIKNVATQYTDPQCVESAWIFIANTIKSFNKNPDLLTSLLDSDFLKKLCSVFPLCLGNGSKSSGLVTFKTAISLLDSLTLLVTYSSQFSNDLLTKCDIDLMMIQIFSSYETDSSALDKSNSNKISVDALLKCPKELMVSLLKLVSSLLPSDPSLIKSGTSDIGNYISITENNKEINSNKLLLVKPEHISLKSFYSSLLPLLLNIYDATVEYKIRRLVFISLLKMICMMSENELENIVHLSKITSILASTITHGKYVLQHKLNTMKYTQLIKLYSLIFGSILIIQSLVNGHPKIFLNDFAKEGLLSQIEDIRSLFSKELGKILDDEANGTKNDRCIDNVNDDDEDEEDEEEEEEEEEDDDIDDIEDEEFGSFTNTLHALHSFKSINDLYIMDDGLKNLSKRTILSSLISLLDAIHEDFERLSTSNNVTKSDNLIFLEKIVSILNDEVSIISESSWIELWKKLAYSLGSNVNNDPITSFELLSSGIMNKLLEIFQRKNNMDSVMCKTFQYIFCSALSPCVNEQASPLFYLVKKLEESLDRNESFDIVGSDSDATQNSRYRAASMTKQMRIKLSPLENSDTTEKGKSVLLVVQAIATFESVQNFIKNSKSINLNNNTNLNSSTLDNDYHYEFYIDGEKIPSDATIYGVIYKSLQSKNDLHDFRSDLLRQPHVINYKYVPGKLISEDHSIFEESVDDTFVAIGEKNIIATLQLLKILYNMNLNVSNPSTSEIVFLNYKLTAKLNRQLDEPLLVASGILPEWAIILPREFPFLFPLETRLFFLKSTSFGYSRLIDYWSAKSNEEGSNSISRNPMLGRSIRHKLRISRDKIFSSAVKVMETYATNPGLIEIEYFDEVGSGLGPTLEFYSNVSKEFGKVKLWMWRSDQYLSLNNNTSEIYVHDNNGLFPRPMHASDPHLNNNILYFKVLGKFLARSFLDSRLVDFHFNPLFFEIAMKFAISKDFKYDIDDSINKIKHIDEGLGSSLQHLNQYLEKFEDLPDENDWENVEISGSKVSDLMLTFVLPGYEEIKLLPDGDDILVTASNLREYINKIIDFTIYDGIKKQIESFVNGFSEIFPFTSMVLFSAEELTRLSGNEIENWSVEALIPIIHADHGYNNKSPQIEWLISIMSNFDNDERRRFLKFITGSPRLPFDGFKGLSPPFTVVLKHCEGDLQPDDYLPSVMTCANYLKLPCYSSREMMYSKIVQAMNEGNNSFLLS